MWTAIVESAKDHGPWIIIAVALIWRGPVFIREVLAYRHKENEGKRQYELQSQRFHDLLNGRTKK